MASTTMMTTGNDDVATHTEPLSVREAFRGKHVLITGATGFVGKVLVSMMLHEIPEVGRLYLLIRPRKNQPVVERLREELIDSPCFDPLRERYSDGLADWVLERVEVVGGDVTEPDFGLDEDAATELAGKIDLVINSAGLTNFNPALDQALDINTIGSKYAAEFVLRTRGRRMLHVSTCYVAGCRDGKVPETELPYGWIPDSSLDKDAFRVTEEIEDCYRLVEQVRARAEDQQRRVDFRTRAKERLVRENRDSHDAEVLDQAIADEKRRWIANQLREEGIARAKHWGWPNIYTFSKSLGEQILTKYESSLELTIARPAIVESALNYPMPGWNEGINTCAPLTYLAGEAVHYYPTDKEVRLDVVPVDLICRGMLLVGAAHLRGEAELIYQLSSSERNPVTMWRITELSTLWHRKRYRNRVSASKFANLVMQNFDTIPASKLKYEFLGTPAIRKTAGGLAKLLGGVPTRSGSPLDRTLNSLTRSVKGVEKAALTVERVVELFLPFIHDNHYIFQAQHVKRLEDRLVPEEFAPLAFNIEGIDWRHYWQEVQMPGLNRWVYPKLRARLNEERRIPHTYDDLLEMLDAAARNHADRPALQLIRDDRIERYTYGDLHTFAERAAARLIEMGLQPGQHVMLMSENRPQWGMTYLGVLKAGATCVPVDPEMAPRDVHNLIDSCKPFALVTSEKVRQRLDEDQADDPLTADAHAGLHHLDLKMLLSDDIALAVPADAVSPDKIAAADSDSAFPRVSTTSIPAVRQPSAGALATTRGQTSQVASLIYTSGTTGRPKGVMLTHRNFTSLLQALHRTFKVDERDGFLSVLPLHHTFEFTSGFLLPLSRGATVTYLDELNPESLERAFESTPITVMIGVPALWQVFHRRIMNQVKSRGPGVRMAFDTLTGLNRFLRHTLGVNAGPILFKQVFDRFGGKIRYFISGGASLPPSVFNTFDGLGITLLEGYGLTETSPVLTVNRPGSQKAGTVGRALPGVDVEIVDPDGDGIGEIRARGANIMLGYHDDPERTEQVLRDGWFYTGDLGQIDRKGRLWIVGRKKEVIVSSSGKNVYPDELEDLFGKHRDIEEMAVVGLPDGSGSERVAALIKPDYDHSDASVDELKAEIREHIEVENSRLPFHQRIKLVRFTDEPLPRTATRKVKRDLVRARIMELDSTRPQRARNAVQDASAAWLFEILAEIGSTEAEAISTDDQLIADLGFDSLMLTELSSRVEEHTGRELDMESLPSSATVRDVLRHAGSGGAAGTQRSARRAHAVDAEVISIREAALAQGLSARHLPSLPTPEEPGLLSSLRLFRRNRDGDIEIPAAVAETGSHLLDLAQKAVYDKGFNVKVYGRANVPYNRPVIVAANHSSHLDMGLVKVALWDFAPNLSALAASDYFFSTPARKAYFKHFTNLIPVERSGSLEESLANASRALEEGRQLVIFPEGTRSTTGDIQPFRRGLGYLAVRHGCDVLPVYIRGTHRALPKGKSIPRSRRLEVFIGEPLTREFLAEQTADLPRGEAYRQVSDLTREAILALKGKRRFFDAYEGDGDGQVDTGNAMLRECIEYLEQGRFVPDTVDSTVTYYFSLEDSDDGKWTLVLGPDTFSFSRGKLEGTRADCVLKCEPSMFRRIVMDSYTPAIEEFMNGTVKTNDPNLLIKFQQAFAL